MDNVMNFIDWHMACSVAVGVAIGYGSVRVIVFLICAIIDVVMEHMDPDYPMGSKYKKSPFTNRQIQGRQTSPEEGE